MSFNKKLVTIDNLRNIYVSEGITEVDKYLTSTDCIILLDAESSKVFNYLVKINNPKKAIKILENK